MGQKTHPIGFRLGIIKPWISNWFADRNFAPYIQQDIELRQYLRKRLPSAGISKIEIERTTKKVTLTIHTARPGIVIGKGGEEIDRVRHELRQLLKGEIQLNVSEIKRPELDARLVGENIGQQLAKQVSYRRAVKKAMQAALRMGAEGIRIHVGGRLGGSEIARSETFRTGRVPLQTLRADLDFAVTHAQTTYGIIGVKVWIFHGEVAT